MLGQACTVSGPPATGVRVAYDEAPASLREWVDDALGSPVVSAITQPGGFSPGVAARLRCADGTPAFCKAVSADVNDFAGAAHRREQRITVALPAEAPVPRLLASYDDGTWVALLLQDLDARQPAVPWRTDELSRVIAALDDLGRLLTPSPVLDAPTLADAEGDGLEGWRNLAAGAQDPAGLDPWTQRNLDRLATLEPRWEPATEGDTLLHLDLRADNLLMAADRVWIVDWPSACTGKAWVDIATLAPSVAMQGGPRPSELIASSVIGRSADRDGLTAWVCALASFFVSQSLQPAPAGLPTVRAFQAAQGIVALEWLRELTGWR